MNPDKIVTRAYWYGFVTHFAFTGWYQDIMGLEKYLVHVKANWIDTHWVMYFVIFAWVVISYQMLKKDL